MPKPSKLTTKLATAPHIALGLLLTGLVLQAVNMRSPLVAIGSIAPTLEQDLGVTPAAIGYLGASPMPLFALGSLLAAWLARRYGLERMMVVMMLILAIGVAIRTWFGVGMLFVGTLIMSFAIGILNALTAPFIKQYALHHIALATGVFSLSMSVLAGVVAWLVVPLSDEFGWQIAMSGWSVFGMLAVLIWLWVYSHQPSVSFDGSEAQQPHTRPTLKKQPINPWRKLAAWQMATLLGVQSFLFYTLASFFPSIGVSFGVSLSVAAWLQTVFQLMAPPAIVILTWAIRRGLPTWWFGGFGCMCNALGVMGLLILPSMMFWWSALMGFGCATVFTLGLMMFSLRTQTAQAASELSSMVQAVGYSIAMFGPLIMGRLFAWQGDWQLPLAVMAILMTINIPFGFWATRQTKIDA